MASSNALNQPKEWGVTKPRSLAEPTNAERASTCRLVEVLSQSYPLRSKEERSKQEAVLHKLEKILKDWVKQLPTETAKAANCKIFTFGSYRLQVDEPGSIIDTLCVGPGFVNREHDFFVILHGLLVKMSEVTEMECVLDAYIPFLIFKLNKVAIKLIYASLPCDVIQEDLYICHNSVMENIDDDVTIHILRGCRITENILELVPNLENFRTTLWCVKFWAKIRHIWSNNVTGFLGESEWAILVARICQAYPNATASTLVTEFFDIFDKWYWPNPVGLCLIEPRVLTVWDRRNDNNGNHYMPIISPAYPHRNLRSDATVSTLREMKVHFKFGDEKCKKIKMNESSWQDLFEPYKFFEQYIRYLHIDIYADSETDLRTLKSYIEPQLRSLILQIEKAKQGICHMCPVEYASSDSYSFFIGLSSETITMGLPLARAVPNETLLVLQSWFDAWNLRKKGMYMRCCQVVKDKMKKQRWGKHSLPVVGQPDAAP